MDEMSNDVADSNLIDNIDNFCKNSLCSIMQIVKFSHALPKEGDDHEFYSSFAGFQEFLTYQKNRLMKFITILMRNNGYNNNFAGMASSSLSDGEEYTDNIVECNDVLLERVAALLDSCESKSKDEPQLEATEPVLPKTNSSTSNIVVSSWNQNRESGDNRTFRLLHAHNILRPQLKFKDKIDNTNTPFIPKIKSKPNALKPLPQRLIDINTPNKEKDSNIVPALSNLISSLRHSGEEDQTIYFHPYEFELRSWEPYTDHLEKVEPQMFLPLDPNSCNFIDKYDDLKQLLMTLQNVKEFAVDLEHHSYRSYQGITCLMQISTRSQDYIVDTLALRSDLWILNDVFTNPSIIKVFHGADFDILWLQKDFGVYVVNMFDTGIASRLLELERFSLQYLAQHYCNIHFDKKYQLADWRIRPLPAEMSLYAQNDTHYLLYIYDVMKNSLLERANGDLRLLRVAFDRSRDLCLKSYEKPLTNEDSHLEFLDRMKRRKSHANRQCHTSQQLEALRLIYLWRDAMARSEDESPGYVLPNHMLLQIAEILPKEAQGVLACCNPIPPLLRQHVQAVHQLVKEARLSSNSSNFKNPEIHTKVPVPAKTEHDSTDVLTCPHDLSRGKTTAKPLVTNGFKLCQVFSKDKSTLFGPFKGDSFSKNVSLSKTNESFCAFSKEKSKPDHVQKKINSILKSAWNPFLLYFPSDGENKEDSFATDTTDDSTNQPLTLYYMLSGKFRWKMCKLDISVDDEEEKEEEPKTFGKVVDIPVEAKRSTDEQVQVLKTMVKRKKISSQLQPVIHVNNLPDQLRLAPNETELFPRSKKAKDASAELKFKKSFGNKSKFSALQKQPQKNKFKRPFQPYQYTNEDYTQFRSQKQVKKRRFN